MAGAGAMLDALLAAGWRFRRPVGPACDAPASQHVYVCNVAGADDAALAALAAPFAAAAGGGAPRVTRCAPTPRQCGGGGSSSADDAGGGGGAYAAAVLSFGTRAAAAAAVAALDGAPPPPPPGGARPLSARFAALEPPQARTHTRRPLPLARCAACALAHTRGFAFRAAAARSRFRAPPPRQAPPAEEPPPAAAHARAEALRIPGLHLLHEFVSEAEEAALLAHVDRPDATWQLLAKRRVQHEGFAFDYAARTAVPCACLCMRACSSVPALRRCVRFPRVCPPVQTRAADAPAPPFGAPVAAVAARLSALPQVVDADASGVPAVVSYDQLTVNEYAAGVGIPPHVDTHSAFAGALASLTLDGAAAMLFRRGDAPEESPRALLLPRRSLLILAGEARLAWQHYIPSRLTDALAEDAGGGVRRREPRRVSLTFRRAVPAGAARRCDCAWPHECDTAAADAAAGASSAPQPPQPPAPQPSPPTEHDDGRAVPALEVAHVRELYERIAPHFSATRFSIWPAVRRFLCAQPPGSLILDAGCGNGKYLGPGASGGVRHAMIGTDASLGLLKLCRAAGRGGVDADVARADAAALPLRARCADAAICVAVLHHLSSGARRAAALAELARVLRPGGTALVTVWALEQEAPAKTLHKWEPIRAAEQKDAAAAAGDDGNRDADADAASQEAPPQEYFVPWHLPLHRPEFGAAARAAAADASGGTSGANSTPRVDDAKGAVVYRRYYHLFAAGELAALARSVPGLAVEAEYFDASNWVVELRRTSA
jgi:alkylated DNA repair protein alkB family protein 8